MRGGTPNFERDSRLIVWPEREKPAPLTIDGPHRRTPPLGERIAGVALAVVLGIVGATLLFHQLSK